MTSFTAAARMTCTSGARPRPATASAAFGRCRSTRLPTDRCLSETSRTFASGRLRTSFTTRSIDIAAGVAGRDLGSVARDVESRLADVRFPTGYHAEALGEYKERTTATKQLFLFGIGAAIVIFALLQASFGVWRLALLSFVTLPIALVGGALAAFLFERTLSLGSLVGFYTVFGIAARNGILMISHFQHLEREEGETFGRALVLRGARERLAPILMTSPTLT